MSSALMRFTTVGTIKPTPKDSNGGESTYGAFDVGSFVYHGNPVGLNYVLKNKRGTIIGFVNATKKRAIIEWSTGQVKRHNVSSLSSSPHKESCEPSKKRKRTAQTCEKVERQSSLVPITCQISLQNKTFEEKSDSDSDRDTDDESESLEWIETLLMEMDSISSVHSV